MACQEKHCPICGEGRLGYRIEKSAVEHKGHNGEVDMCFAVCDACGSEQADSAAARTNKRAMAVFRKKLDGLLTGAEIRSLRERLGITQAQAAEVFGGGPVAFSKYEADDVTQSEAMDKLLRMADELPEAWQRLCSQAGVTPRKQTGWARVNVDRQRPAAVLHLKLVHSSDFETEPQRRYGS